MVILIALDGLKFDVVLLEEKIAFYLSCLIDIVCLCLHDVLLFELDVLVNVDSVSFILIWLRVRWIYLDLIKHVQKIFKTISLWFGRFLDKVLAKVVELSYKYQL